MRQYYILYKRGKAAFVRLKPNEHQSLYNKSDVLAAIAYMAVNVACEGIALRINEDEMYNIIAFTQPAEAPNSFPFAS